MCLFAMIGMFFLTGCDTGDKVSLDAVDAPLREMCARHDAYVKADPKLEAVEKDIALRTSALVIRALDTAQRKTPKKATTSVTGNGNPVIVQGSLLGQSYADTVKLTGITRAYQYEDATKCQQEGTCTLAVVSTSDLAKQGLYFQSKLEMDTYLQGRKKKLSDPKDVILYEYKQPTRADLIKNLEASEKLVDRWARSF